MRIQVWQALVVTAICLWTGCSNDPYPRADRARKVLYRSFSEAPKSLDPAVAYTTAAHAITGNVYESLLEYDYLARPYRLIPALATAIPEPQPLSGGRVAYRFEIRRGVRFADDPCFAAADAGKTTREVTASDFAFELARIADPAVGSPIIQSLEKISGFKDLGPRLAERRKDPAFAALPLHDQYAALGGIPGVRVLDDHQLELVLDAPFPQLLYWLAMPFTAPVPWEAVAYYDGREGRPHFRDHPVATGPFQLTEYNKQALMVLDRNPHWREWPDPSPGHWYPIEAARDVDSLSDAARTREMLPFIERIEYRREKEAIPAFAKFLQGYYDASPIINESFDRVIREDRISPDMAARGMRLEKSVEPGVYYLGFNMDDPVVGHAAGDRGRKLRQAMSLVIDTEELKRLFMNDRGVAAQSPIPPGLFGYDPEYRNPYRRVDASRAKALLSEAGYPGGIDPATGRPLELYYDTADTTSSAQLMSQFYVQAWRSIGLDVEVRATTYNQFQEKMRNGAYQLFRWGWIADYPDPENFLFLLESSNGRTQSGGPNSANYANPEYDALFARMKSRPDDDERLALIREMVAILERDRPWIELYHPEDYSLFQPWLRNVESFGMSYPMLKYYDLEPELRTTLRAEWNDPITWPAYTLAGLLLVVTLPGVATYFRERI